MTKRSFFSLICGLLGVALVVSSVMVYRGHLDARVPASKAILQSTDYGIGVDYAGVLVRQNIQKGEMVKRGQLLGLLKSGTLIERIREAKLTAADLPYKLDKDNNIELRATNDGIVQSVDYTSGAFVPGNHNIYEITSASQYFVTATFARMSRVQVNDLSADKGVQLTFGDGKVMPARIRSIHITPNESTYNVELELIPASQPSVNNVKVGEPLDATLILEEEDTYTRIVAKFNHLRDTIAHR
jgi:hypothetical protein